MSWPLELSMAVIPLECQKFSLVPLEPVDFPGVLSSNMRLLLVFLTSLIVVVRSSQAQDQGQDQSQDQGQDQKRKIFHWHLTAGVHAGADSNAGITIASEPAFRVADNITVGLRLASSSFSRKHYERRGDRRGYYFFSVDDEFWSYSLSGFAKYYLPPSSRKRDYRSRRLPIDFTEFRLYAGFGLGLSSVGSTGSSRHPSYPLPIESIEDTLEVLLVFYPRIGFDVRRFNFNIDLNILPSSDISLLDFGKTFNNTNVSITAGAFLFGGKPD